MPIISKETWDKFTQEEKEKITNMFDNFKEYRINMSDEKQEGVCYAIKELFPEEALQPQLTYEDVARELLGDKQVYWAYAGDILHQEYTKDGGGFDDPALCISQNQAEKLLAINKLLNVAAYLNKNEDGTPWKPDWEDEDNDFYCLAIDPWDKDIIVTEVNKQRVSTEIVYFRTKELAKQAIQILGEDTVRLALTTEY